MSGVGFFPRLALVVVLIAGTMQAVAAADLTLPADSAAIQAALQGSGPLVLAGRTLDKAMLTALYQPHSFQPIWTERRAQSFQGALADADTHGLDANPYEVATTKPVARELLLTDAFLRYAS